MDDVALKSLIVNTGLIDYQLLLSSVILSDKKPQSEFLRQNISSPSLVKKNLAHRVYAQI